MTARQEQIINSLRKDIIEHDGLGMIHSTDYEYKRFEITNTESGLVFVLSEVGRKGDEGTMAELLARTTRNIMITPKGKVTLLNAKDMRVKETFSHKTHYVTGYSKALYSLTA